MTAWIAGKDHVGHARPDRGRVTRTRCGAPAIEPRFGWPVARYCQDCVRLVTADERGTYTTSVRR
jgi:hypothetical protein